MSSYNVSDRVYGALNVDGYGSQHISFTTAGGVDRELGNNSTYLFTADQDCYLAMLDGYGAILSNGLNVPTELHDGAGESSVTAARGFPLWAAQYLIFTTSDKRNVISVMGYSASGTLFISKLDPRHDKTPR